MRPLSEHEYIVDPDTGCWVWQRARSHDNYGLKCLSGGNIYAHRFVYEREVGPIPEGLDLDHLCHDPNTCPCGVECPHRACVNPDHLEPVTRSENLRRAAKDLCKNGHPMSPDNTYVAPATGRRSCKICRRDAVARHYWRNR